VYDFLVLGILIGNSRINEQRSDRLGAKESDKEKERAKESESDTMKDDKNQ
jgi:hypothetical protein